MCSMLKECAELCTLQRSCQCLAPSDTARSELRSCILIEIVMQRSKHQASTTHYEHTRDCKTSATSAAKASTPNSARPKMHAHKTQNTSMSGEPGVYAASGDDKRAATVFGCVALAAHVARTKCRVKKRKHTAHVDGLNWIVAKML